MVQQGQVFKLRTKTVEGKAVWAYRYRLEGRGSTRPQVGGGFATRADALKALDVHSIDVLAVICNLGGKSASIFGTATIKGAGSFDYRIDVTDNGQPGIGSDTYRIRLSTGYDSGEQTLVGGNIKLH
jgi:hypothetical protein